MPSIGRCVGAAWFAVMFGACSSGDVGAAPPASASQCTRLDPGELLALDADVHALARGEPLGGASGSLARALLPDGGDVYWYDVHGSVFVERQGDGRVVELKHGEPPSEAQREVGLGLAANANRLFVGYGWRPISAIDFGSLEYNPPGRLLSISKQDGQSEVLLELADRWLTPIAADAERVIVFALGQREVGFYQVPLAAPRLEPLPLTTTLSPEGDSDVFGKAVAPFTGGQLVGNEMYWVNHYDFPKHLLRSGFDDAEPDVVMQVPDEFAYWVGPGYILTQEDAYLADYRYAGKDFVVRDDSGGCRSLLGPRGKSVVDTALEANVAYWSGGTAAGLEPTADGIALTRIDLESGAVTRLNTPGFTPAYYLNIVGHDATRLFLYSADTLASLRKP